MGRLLTPLLLAILVLACGGTSAPSASPSASAAVASASPSGSFLTTAEAATAYSAVADPYNTAIDRAQAKFGARTTLEEHQGYWAAIAKADKAFIDGLKKIAFPPEMQSDADVLIKADTAFQQRALAVSRARSAAEVISLGAAANDAADVVAAKAAILRERLDLGY
jgi:hypothetical protein